MHLSRRNIYARAHAESLLRGACILRICDCQGAVADQMRCQSSMRMRWIVGVPILVHHVQSDDENAVAKSTNLWTHGPSVHVKTWEKPHSLTIFSSCDRDVVRVDILQILERVLSLQSDTGTVEILGVAMLDGGEECIAKWTIGCWHLRMPRLVCARRA